MQRLILRSWQLSKNDAFLAALRTCGEYMMAHPRKVKPYMRETNGAYVNGSR